MNKVLRWLAATSLIVGLMIAPSLAQISISNFTSSVPVATLNSILNSISSNALNRTGGTITGNIAVNSGVTIDGVDVSAQLGGSGTPSFAGVTVTGTGASALDVAGGINAGTGNVGIVDTTGKIPAISGTYFSSLSGSLLTGLSFSQLSTTWSTQSYAAGNFTANGSLTWTVDAPDLVASSYFTMGKTMFWTVYIVNSTTGGTTNTELRIAIPGGNTIAAVTSGVCSGFSNGTAADIQWIGQASNNYVTLFKDFGANWTVPATNNNSFSCSFMLSIN